MKPNAFPLLLSLIFLLALSPVGHAASDSEESKALKAQRKEALKERQALQKDQNKRNKDAIADFKSHRSDYKAQAKQLVTDLKTAYELKRVSLNAEHQARIAEAEAEFREQWTAMLLKQRDKKETLEVIQEEAKRYAEALFQLRKQSALELHQAELTYEREVNAELTGLDRDMLEKAGSLGLTAPLEPVLATPIGGVLTEKEEKWNEKEQTRVQKLLEKNQKLIAEYEVGTKLRQWEIDNLQEDFDLEWKEKEELQALDSQISFFTQFAAQSAGNAEAQQQDFMKRLSEIQKERQLIGIKYKKIRDENRIKRREAKKQIRSNAK